MKRIRNFETFIKINEELDEKYSEKTIENGIIISVGYDSWYEDYTIYFPQISVGDAGGPGDQVLRISQDAAEAKKYFEMAKQMAKAGKKPNDIYFELQKMRDS